MTTNAVERRTFLGATAGSAVALATVAIQAQAQPRDSPAASRTSMSYAMKPMPFDPQKIKGLSERVLISHYENNYGGAVNRLNSISDQLATLDYDKAPGFLINGLKREKLIATNSMILHEFYFAGLGCRQTPGTRSV
jgi:Fe-Mn family superoxide dismutase